MAKEKVTLTLDAENLAAVDEWLAELDAQHGPVPPGTLEWAARLVDDWEGSTQPTVKRRRRAG
jgi:hypothetical protein